MNESAARDVRDRLWWLTFGPLIWATHFLATYITTAIWCAKYVDADESATGIRITVGIYTVVALLLITGVAIFSYRRHRSGTGVTPHDDPTFSDQRRFLGFAAFLLSCLSGVATAFTAMVYVFIASCH